MIPSNKELRKKLTPEICYQILMHKTNYFSIAEEYVSLQKIFLRDTFLEKLEIWMEMIISPLIMIVTSLFNWSNPDLFQLMSLQKCAKLWKDWIRMRELRSEVHVWIRVIRSIGGPFISTNDPDYHMFVYADGMQRLHDLLTVPKERTKCL